MPWISYLFIELSFMFFFPHSFDTCIWWTVLFFSSDFSENVHTSRDGIWWERKSVAGIHWTVHWAKNVEQVHGSLAITNKTSYVLVHWYASNRKKVNKPTIVITFMFDVMLLISNSMYQPKKMLIKKKNGVARRNIDSTNFSQKYCSNWALLLDMFVNTKTCVLIEYSSNDDASHLIMS